MLTIIIVVLVLAGITFLFIKGGGNGTKYESHQAVNASEFFKKVGFNFHLKNYSTMPDEHFNKVLEFMNGVNFGYIRDQAFDTGVTFKLNCTRLNNMASPTDKLRRKVVLLTEYIGIGHGTFDPANQAFFDKHSVIINGGDTFSWSPIPIFDRKTDIAYIELFNEPDHRASYLTPPNGLMGSCISHPDWPTKLSVGVMRIDGRISSVRGSVSLLLPSYVNSEQHDNVRYVLGEVPEKQLAPLNNNIGTVLSEYLKANVHIYGSTAQCHPYVGAKQPEPGLVDHMKHELAYQDKTKIVVGETGYAAHGPEDTSGWVTEYVQSVFTLRAIAHLIKNGAEAVILYEFLDSELIPNVPRGLQCRFGLVAATGTMESPTFRAKPVYLALKLLSDIMGELGDSSTATTLKMNMTHSGNVEHMVYYRAKDKTHVILMWMPHTSYSSNLGDVGTYSSAVTIELDSKHRVSVTHTDTGLSTAGITDKTTILARDVLTVVEVAPA